MLGDVIANLGFYAIAAAVIIFALLVVTMKNAFHCALSLAAALICVAGIFLYLGAEFLAVVQVLIYVGAIVTLIIFAIMLTSKLADGAIKQTNKQRFPSFFIASAFFAILVVVFMQVTWPVIRPADDKTALVQLDQIGNALFSRYMVPFEVISIVLLAALIGALYIARPTAKQPRRD